VGPPLDALVDRLARRGPGQGPLLALDGAHHSAVLVALSPGEEGTEVLLTRRSRHMRSHRGEVSFPGGRIDPGETPAGAACREAFEEVGLDPGAPRIIGELDHLSTVSSHSHIVPVVATLPGRPIVHPASAEVERVLHVPLADLLRPGTYREERWGSPPFDRSVYFFELDDETVWGATGRILLQLLSVATGVAG
jgi:8-oxo-dGTP pyrophosphatase MutT (NUDIX family)